MWGVRERGVKDDFQVFAGTTGKAVSRAGLGRYRELNF